MIKISNNQIAIRNFLKKDIPLKVEMINKKDNNKFLHYDLPLKEEKTLAWFENAKNDTSRLDLTILYDDKIAGMIGLLNIDKRNKKAEYYICVDKAFSGKGIGTIASNLLFEYAFDKMKLNKIYLFTEKNNIIAQRLFEKLGFRKEGLLKDDMIYNDKLINRFAYGLCRDEYYAKNNYS
ncbi:GNAT family N-acetyltransferase [Candidatus Saccharibacteria bacterium]|nr:GNAT family N-acetyltransferase [Candidatus Saccharibacteria bacterium]